MSPAGRPQREKSRGISLVEVVLLIILMGIAAAGLITLSSAIGRQQSTADVRQRAVQLIEACADRLLSSRRLLVSTDVGSSESQNPACSASSTAPICECHALVSGSNFSPYRPLVVVYRAPSLFDADLCYSAPIVANSPDCVQIQIGAISGSQELGSRVFLQLSE